MKLIATFDIADCTVEAYCPERGRTDIWTLWVVKDGQVISESSVRRETSSVWALDKDAQVELKQHAIEAVSTCHAARIPC